MSEVKLSKLEQQALTAWRDCQVGYGFGFRMVERHSETPSHLIRRVVRSLARKGMVEYCRSLFNEDEGTMGAGYTLTEQGSKFLGKDYG